MPAVKQIIQDHTFRPKVDEHYNKLLEDLEIQQSLPLSRLILKVHQKEITVEEFLKQAEALALPKFKENIWPGILRYDFLPVADALGLQIENWLSFLSAKESDGLRIVRLNKWLTTYLKDEEWDAQTAGDARLGKILSDFLSGLKDEDETKKIMMLEEKIGGLELAEEDAKKIIEDFRNRLFEAWDNDEIITNQEVKLRQADVKEPLSALNLPRKPADAGLLRELSLPSVPVPVPAQNFYETAESIIKKSGLYIVPDLEGRLKTILVSGLKEVRKITEVRERLLATVAIGGMGFKKEEAEIFVKLVEETKKNGVAQSKLATENKKIVEEIVLAPAPDIKKIEASPAPPSPPANLPMATVLASQLKTTTKSNFAPTSSDIRSVQTGAVKIIPQEKKPPKVELMPTPIPAKTPVTEAIPQTPSGRSKVEDVVFRTRLIGPVEELSGMMLLDFHRLSPKPKVAVDKIHSKIELLANQGYTKRIQGIQAWQKSPVNQLYVLLLNDGIKKGVPVKQIIEERKNAGKEILTPEEFQEIMEFNRSLHF